MPNLLSHATKTCCRCATTKLPRDKTSSGDIRSLRFSRLPKLSRSWLQHRITALKRGGKEGDRYISVRGSLRSRFPGCRGNYSELICLLYLESRCGQEPVVLEGGRLRRLRGNLGRNARGASHADLCVLPDAESLAVELTDLQKMAFACEEDAK